MRLSATSTEETEGYWYFVDPKKAKPFPYPHTFGSRVWDHEKGQRQSGPGEVAEPLYRWKHQVNPNGNIWTGKRFCGPKEAFRGGSSVSDPTLEPTTYPKCCHLAFARFKLSVRKTGGFVPPDCNPVRIQWTASYTLISGSCAAMPDESGDAFFFRVGLTAAFGDGAGNSLAPAGGPLFGFAFFTPHWSIHVDDFGGSPPCTGGRVGTTFSLAGGCIWSVAVVVTITPF